MQVQGRAKTHTSYIVGFRNVLLARKVHYTLPPEPQFTLVRGDQIIDLSDQLASVGYDIELNLDVKAALFVPKIESGSGGIWSPMNDVGFFMSRMDEGEFLSLPILNNQGVIIPYELEDETENEYMFRSIVIDPTTTR